jgi:hypothetical protein
MATTIKKTDPKPPSKPGAPASKPSTRATRTPRQYVPLFGKENYRWMLIGILLIALGLVLMSGGKNPDPNTFDPNLTYSFRRITLAPILVLGGFVVEIFAIFKKGKNNPS